MNKLQLYIYMSRRGFKSVRCINPAENIQTQIPQFRQGLEMLDYNADEKYLFYALRYTDSGTLFTVLRTIPNDAGDHLASYIFIPNGLKISTQDLYDVVQRVTRVVSSPSVTTAQLADLQQLFSKQYEFDANAPSMAASMGKELAVAYYGGDTGLKLSDFLGEYIFQPQFLGWHGVLLVDADLGVSTDARVLQNVKIRKTVTLLPPDVSDTKFAPHIYHHPFTRPFRAELGGTVQVRWHRGGFEEQMQDYKVESDGAVLPTPATDDSRKAITPASFYITSQTSKKQITDATIRVNGVEITGSHTFTQSELKNALVEVTAPGFAPFRSHFDLASTAQALIQLPEHRRVYRFELTLRNSSMGAPLHIEIPSKGEITESPIEGYEATEPIREGANRMNRLRYAPPISITRKWLIIAVVAAMVIGLGFGMLIGKSGHSAPVPGSAEAAVQNAQEQKADATAQQPAKPAKPAAQQQPAKPAEQKPVAANSTTASAAAINYLDNNTAWTKEGLEKYPELKGLFEDMNTYNFTNIINVWGPKLSKSTRFGKLVGFVNNCLHKKKFVPGAGDTFCKSGDTKIRVYSYCCRIDP